jgi:hypothetical protein
LGIAAGAASARPWGEGSRCKLGETPASVANCRYWMHYRVACLHLADQEKNFGELIRIGEIVTSSAAETDRLCRLQEYLTKRVCESTQMAVVYLGILLARCEASPLMNDRDIFWTIRKHSGVLLDRCLASRRAIRHADDAQRISVSISACHAAAAAGDAFNDPLLRISAMRHLRNTARDWSLWWDDESLHQTLQREKEKADAYLREKGVRFWHKDGGGWNDNPDNVTDNERSFADCCVLSQVSEQTSPLSFPSCVPITKEMFPWLIVSCLLLLTILTVVFEAESGASEREQARPDKARFIHGSRHVRILRGVLHRQNEALLFVPAGQIL